MIKEEEYTEENALKDYVLLFISIFIVGSSITLITKAGLGATAVTSLPFVISEIWGFSFGTMTAIFNVIWVLLQMAIQRKNFPKIQLLQFGVAFILGFAVDLANIIFSFVTPQNYFMQLLTLVIGCALMGFGVFVQLKSDTVYNPAEGIVAVITDHVKYNFSTVKTTFDSTLVVLSILLGLIVTGGVVGIREGTILSAVLIGPFIGLFQKLFDGK